MKPELPVQVPVEAGPLPPEGTGGSNGTVKKAAGLGAVLLGLLAKAKGGLLLLKALPVGKLLLTSGTLAASVLAYSLRGGFWFALGFVLLILVHELGHGVAMRRHGVRSGWPIFIPFVGAMIAMHDQPRDPNIEAEVAYGGPVAGTAGSLLCAAIALVFQKPFFLALAYSGFFLNLFNLVPFGFLDGGRIARLLSPKASIVGGVLLVGLFFMSPSPQLLMIAVLGGLQAFRRSNQDLERVTKNDRMRWAVRYLGLCAFLAAAATFSHKLTESSGW